MRGPCNQPIVEVALQSDISALIGKLLWSQIVRLAHFESIVQQPPELEQATKVMTMNLHLLDEAWAGEDDTQSSSWCPLAGQAHIKKTADG